MAGEVIEFPQQGLFTGSEYIKALKQGFTGLEPYELGDTPSSFIFNSPFKLFPGVLLPPFNTRKPDSPVFTQFCGFVKSSESTEGSSTLYLPPLVIDGSVHAVTMTRLPDDHWEITRQKFDPPPTDLASFFTPVLLPMITDGRLRIPHGELTSQSYPIALLTKSVNSWRETEFKMRNQPLKNNLIDLLHDPLLIAMLICANISSSYNSKSS